MFEPLISVLDEFVGTGVVGSDCVVYQDGKEIFRRQTGCAEAETNRPLTGKERYNLYSCSKPITVTAALQLYEKGLYKLDDPISLYLPEFAEMTVKEGDTLRKAQTPITIRHLFTMTAGLSYDTNSPGVQRAREATGGRCPTRETMKYLAQDPLLFEPGTRWNYSFCHDVLAALVEVLSGERFGEYVREHIFDPLGMKDSTFLLPDSELSTITPQYRFNTPDGSRLNCGPAIQLYKLGSEYESGGAGLISTLEDYIKFAEALRTGVLLRPETVKLLSTDQLSPQVRPTYSGSAYGYGLGFRCPLDNPGSFTDFGWGGYAGAYLCIDLPRRISFFYVQHGIRSPIHLVRHRLYLALLHSLGETDLHKGGETVDP